MQRLLAGQGRGGHAGFHACLSDCKGRSHGLDTLPRIYEGNARTYRGVWRKVHCARWRTQNAGRRAGDEAVGDNRVSKSGTGEDVFCVAGISQSESVEGRGGGGAVCGGRGSVRGWVKSPKAEGRRLKEGRNPKSEGPRETEPRQPR